MDQAYENKDAPIILSWDGRQQSEAEPRRYLTRAGAAALLSEITDRLVTVQSMARWAWEGKGPPFVVVLGRCCYSEEDLLAWVDSITRQPRGKAMRRARA
jgi:hypothetical protein